MNALQREIESIVASEGPIGVDRYMALALGHPVHGYYTTRDPFGAAGDFTTAPEISQMFGELLGLWAVTVWRMMGAPTGCRLVEFGPGRGTLMADALRAARRVPAFLDSCSIHLVETSPTLRQRQAAALPGRDVAWHAGFEQVPDGPCIVLANEFVDALPIRQFVRRDDGWRERVVGLAADGRLAFGLAPHTVPDLDPVRAEAGDVLETCPAAQDLAAAMAQRVVTRGGAALFVDYGPARDGFGDTLQAMRAHGHADPLDRPGEQDLTAHVRFGALAHIASVQGAATHGPVGQGPFLESLGIRERAAALAKGRDRTTQDGIVAALGRLTSRDAMGELFKAFAIADPRLGPLPGLPPGDAAAPRG